MPLFSSAGVAIQYRLRNMPSQRHSENLRELVRQRDNNRCAYCLTGEANSGIPLTVDHIIPTSKGGQTAIDNLCLACRPCNEFKAGSIEAQDPLTGEIALLFNPRTNNGPIISSGALTVL